MIVFKNYLKVAKSFLPIIIVYTLIFVGIATISSTSGAQNTDAFEASESRIAFINHDQESSFINSFQKYIKENAEYVNIQDSDEELRDALFFRKVDYIMIIPKGFTDDFLNNKDVKIETMEVPDSYNSMYSKTLMNKYLNTAKLYLKADIADDKLTQYVSRDLNIHTDVDFHNVVVDNNIAKATTFYNFANYTLLAIIIVVVSMVMISFNEEKIRRRNLVSSISYQSFNRQLLLGNIITSIGVWSLYVIVSFALYGATMLTNAGLLLILNSFVLVIFILVFSFFLTTVTHNRELVSGISTVVGLGTSFIAGAFVPQEFLAPFVLNIAKLTPSYWFIDGNNKIASLSGYSWTELQPIIMNMAIILGFAVLFYILIQLVSRLKLKKS